MSKWWAALGWATPALAETAQAPQQPGYTQAVFLGLIFAIFYFLIIRPQQKKQKLHAQFLTELKRGDMIVTNAGIVGTIKQLSERFVILEIGDGGTLKMLRTHVSESANNLKDDLKKV